MVELLNRMPVVQEVSDCTKNGAHDDWILMQLMEVILMVGNRCVCCTLIVVFDVVDPSLTGGRCRGRVFQLQAIGGGKRASVAQS